jgi:DNA (cytosine-5)-methyltransferase 1
MVRETKGEVMRELALFAGAGGGILGGTLLGWRTVCAVEIESFCREVLLRRQLDGCLPCFPIWDDVCTFDGKPWRGCVDIITGGFPCQDISCAGKGKGLEGERSGLWGQMARIIREVRPRFALVENSPMLTSRGLGVVLGDLAELGMDARWGVLGADDTGAPHIRKRIFILANTVRDSRPLGLQHWHGPTQNERDQDARFWGGHWGEPKMGKATDPILHFQQFRFAPLVRVVDGVPDVVDRLKAIGNAQVPAVVALAWSLLKPT